MSPRDWWAMLGTEDGAHFELRFRLDDEEHVDSPWVRLFVPVEDQARFVRLVDAPCDPGRLGFEDFSLGMVPRRLPLPEGMQPAEYMGMSAVVWARLDNGKQAKLLERFRPAPTVVLREGKSVHRTAVWWLTRALNVVQLERANKRLAHALGCKKKFADPGYHLFVPGTVLRNAGKRPVAVHVESETGGRYTPKQVFGHLQDAPEPKDWREAA